MNFGTKLPTNLPGIFFTCNGRVRVRRARGDLTPTREAHAAVLSSIYTLASTITIEFPPEAQFAAEQAIKAAFVEWRTLEDRPSIELKAKLGLNLYVNDASKADRFNESRRAARLDEALVRDHMAFLHETALKNESTARLWWLHLNLAGNNAATSWADFDKYVRPIIANDDHENDPVARFTAAMLTLTNRIDKDPLLLESLSRVAVASLKIMDQIDIAEQIDSVTGSAKSTEQSNNGSTSDQPLQQSFPGPVRGGSSIVPNDPSSS